MHCCAGSTESRYGELDAIAWYDGNSGNHSHAVATKAPNAWPLRHAGNVWQWCSDWYGAYPTPEQTVIDPTGPDSGVLRVFRGGLWNYGAGYARAASRYSINPVDRYGYLGFRLAMSAKP